jgi:hypothetical protein
VDQPTTPGGAAPRRRIVTDLPVAALSTLGALAVYATIRDPQRGEIWMVLAGIAAAAALVSGTLAFRRHPVPGLKAASWFLVIASMTSGSLFLGAHAGLGVTTGGRTSQMCAVLGFGLVGASQMVLARSRPNGGKGLRMLGTLLLVIAGMKLLMP